MNVNVRFNVVVFLPQYFFILLRVLSKLELTCFTISNRTNNDFFRFVCEKNMKTPFAVRPFFDNNFFIVQRKIVAQFVCWNFVILCKWNMNPSFGVSKYIRKMRWNTANKEYVKSLSIIILLCHDSRLLHKVFKIIRRINRKSYVLQSNIMFSNEENGSASLTIPIDNNNSIKIVPRSFWH